VGPPFLVPVHMWGFAQFRYGQTHLLLLTCTLQKTAGVLHYMAPGFEDGLGEYACSYKAGLIHICVSITAFLIYEGSVTPFTLLFSWQLQSVGRICPWKHANYFTR
jgi:hypothetical protein